MNVVSDNEFEEADESVPNELDTLKISDDEVYYIPHIFQINTKKKV